MTDRFTAYEERIAHLERVVEDLSAVVARQDREIDRLSARLRILVEREAERGAEMGSVPLADQKPPHW